MKKINSIILLLLGLAGYTSCNRYKPDNRMVKPGKTDSVMVMHIPDAKCENCQKVLEDGLIIEAGVKQALLNLNTNYLTVVYNPSLNEAQNLRIKVSELQTKMPCK